MALFLSRNMAVSDPGNNVKIYTITEGTQSGFPKEKHFCGNCGCTLWTVPRKYGGMIRMIRTSLLDNGYVLVSLSIPQTWQHGS